MERIAHGYGLVEAPVYSADYGLLFSDVLGGGVYAVDDAGVVRTVFEHRRGIGGIALHEAGGLIVSGRNISYKPFDGGSTQTVLDRDPDAGNVGYNDLVADAAGRIYAGSLGSSPVFDDGREPLPGALHLIDLDGSSRIVATDISLTKGLGFSPDGRRLYHADTRAQTVWVYDVEADGNLSEKRPFAKTGPGSPDGLAVAEDGSVWVAIADGGIVAVFEPDGTLVPRSPSLSPWSRASASAARSCDISTSSPARKAPMVTTRDQSSSHRWRSPDSPSRRLASVSPTALNQTRPRVLTPCLTSRSWASSRGASTA